MVGQGCSCWALLANNRALGAAGYCHVGHAVRLKEGGEVDVQREWRAGCALLARLPQGGSAPTQPVYARMSGKAGHVPGTLNSGTAPEGCKASDPPPGSLPLRCRPPAVDTSDTLGEGLSIPEVLPAALPQVATQVLEKVGVEVSSSWCAVGVWPVVGLA